MIIRKANIDDSKNISDLLSVLSEKFLTGNFSPRGHAFLLESMTADSIKKYMHDGYRYHVAEMDNRLVGVVAVKGNTHLYHLFVAEEFHRRGIARKMWQVAMDASFAEADVKEFTVNSSEYAIDVYKRLGFVAQLGPRIKNDVVFYPMKLKVDRQS